MATEVHQKISFLWIVILIFFFLSSIYGQIVIHKNLSVESGLIYSQVLCAYQDQKGYMWFGTSSGVSRWDGHKFENFHSDDQIRFDNVKLITELSNGLLIFVTRHSLIIYENGNFREEDTLPDTLKVWIEQAVKLRDGNIYLAGQDSGVWVFNGREFIEVSKEIGQNGSLVRSLFLASDSTLLMGTDKDGLQSFKNGVIYPVIFPGGKLIHNMSWVHQSHNGVIYIGTKGHGLIIFENNELLILDNNNGMPSNTINHIYEDSSGILYVATDQGIAIISNNNIRSVITSNNGLSNIFTWYVAEDRQGNIYICTDGGGIDIYRPGVYQTYNKNSGLPDQTVWSILETSDDQFYFATDFGVAMLDHKISQEVTLVDKLSDYMVITIHEAKDGTLYFGTNENGVCILKHDQFSNLNTSNGLTSNSVWSIVEDSEGRIYLGTYDGGICVYQNDQVVDTINTEDGLANDFIVSAYTPGDGRVYFGLDNGGVYQVLDGRLDYKTIILSELTVWSFFQNTAGTLYMGTDKNGLVYVTPSGTDTITIADGLSNNAILGIMEDDNGKIYLTTDNGMNVLDFSQRQPHIRIITHEDGLASNECNQGAYLKDSEGNLWIGTIRGVTRYNPSADYPSHIPPQTHITGMRIFDRNVMPESGRDLAPFRYNENFIQFHFIGIDLIAPHKVHYRYRLNNGDDDWNHSDFPQVQLANLEDNDYRFEVQSGNEWGAWSEPAVIQFSILPPFWETWWFRLILVAVAGGLLGSLIYSRIRSLLAIERVRAKIAADLHDDIGAGLSEINILSAVAEIKTPPEAKKHVQNELNRISKTAGQIIDSMSDIVWMVNPKKDSMTDLVSRLKDIFNDVLDAKHIVFHSENMHLLKKIKLDMEQRQFLFLIFKEGMNNAVKYSDCTEITMIISFERKKLKIILSDNGRGFEMEKMKAGNGLINMRDRAEKIKGNLSIESRPGEGTRLEFTGKI